MATQLGGVSIRVRRRLNRCSRRHSGVNVGLCGCGCGQDRAVTKQDMRVEVAPTIKLMQAMLACGHSMQRMLDLILHLCLFPLFKDLGLAMAFDPMYL